MKKYVVDLSEQEKERLEDLSTKGKGGFKLCRERLHRGGAEEEQGE